MCINSEFNKCFVLKTKHDNLSNLPIKTKMFMHLLICKDISENTYRGNIYPEIQNFTFVVKHQSITKSCISLPGIIIHLKYLYCLKMFINSEFNKSFI